MLRIGHQAPYCTDMLLTAVAQCFGIFRLLIGHSTAVRFPIQNQIVEGDGFVFFTSVLAVNPEINAGGQHIAGIVVAAAFLNIQFFTVPKIEEKWAAGSSGFQRAAIFSTGLVEEFFVAGHSRGMAKLFQEGRVRLCKMEFQRMVPFGADTQIGSIGIIL